MSSGNLGSGSGGTSPYDDANNSNGSPLPDFNASNIRLATIAPAFGISSSSLTSGPGSQHLSTTRTPDYLDYDQKGRGIVSTMFTNSGISYLIGVSLGGLYGLREGLARTPSSRWKVKLNSVLNHCGRHGSGWGNMMGSTAILYSLYEGIADTVSLFLVF
jgi:import inner membrane translocase subunit TIM23